jgi:hypothetical protein
MTSAAIRLTPARSHARVQLRDTSRGPSALRHARRALNEQYLHALACDTRHAYRAPYAKNVGGTHPAPFLRVRRVSE